MQPHWFILLITVKLIHMMLFIPLVWCRIPKGRLISFDPEKEIYHQGCCSESIKCMLHIRLPSLLPGYGKYGTFPVFLYFPFPSLFSLTPGVQVFFTFHIISLYCLTYIYIHTWLATPAIHITSIYYHILHFNLNSGIKTGPVYFRGTIN